MAESPRSGAPSAADSRRHDPRLRDSRILAVVRALGEGEVTTYGDIAEVAGYPGLSRHVGHLLASHDDPALPWWRVVNASGRLVPGGEVEQAALLGSEGVRVAEGRVREAPVGRFSPADRRGRRRRSGP